MALTSTFLVMPTWSIPLHTYAFQIQPLRLPSCEMMLQHQSFQLIFRTDLIQDGLVGSPCSPRDSQESSPTPQFKSINSLALSFLYSPTLTSIYDYWKNHSFDQTDLCWQSKSLLFNMLCRLVIAFLCGVTQKSGELAAHSIPILAREALLT